MFTNKVKVIDTFSKGSRTTAAALATALTALSMLVVAASNSGKSTDAEEDRKSEGK